MKPLLKLGLLLLCSLFFTSSFAQPRDGDSNAVYSAMYKRYMAGIGGAAALYSGAEYEGAYPRVLGSPFWNSKDFERGSISYEGIIYRDVLLAYDLVRSEVLIKGFQQLSQRLEKAKVDYFSLGGHTFVHLRDTVSKNSVPDDFYDLLYTGNVRAYARRTKTITKAFSAESQDTITSRNVYFLYKDGGYFGVGDAKDLQTAFSNGKDVLKPFWKEQKLNFKKEPESFITQTLRYWEQRKK